MDYCSTRNEKISVTDCEAIVKGIAPDGGLFVPRHVPKLSMDEILDMASLSYPKLAARVMTRFLPSFGEESIAALAEKAYGSFFGEPAPLARVSEDIYALELWHGPTCAFKDMALQLMPLLFAEAKKKLGDGNDSIILTATSGDTGKAALEGFRDVPGTRIMVLYPRDGVSEAQRLQMITQAGDNVFVAGLNGNFDDAQRLAKRLMTDVELISVLCENNAAFSSANSINWGRLAPQIVYYFHAYLTLVRQNAIKPKEKISFCVPSGNFGDILAGYYAGLMGLPVSRLICASNRNDVLTEFVNTGVYDAGRELLKSVSPSMDILVSSNVERLLWLLAGDKRVRELMDSLQVSHRYALNESELDEVQKTFSAYCCSEDATLDEIRTEYRVYGYLSDTHTAVAFNAARQYLAETGDADKTVIVSTASPFKFSKSVLAALGEASEKNSAEKLSALTGKEIPPPLRDLDSRRVRFDNGFEPDEIKERLLSFALEER